MTGTRTRWWDVAGAAAGAAGAAVWLTPSVPLPLAPPVRCPGALELLAVGFARLAPDAPLGLVVSWSNLLLAAGGVAAVIWLLAGRLGRGPAVVAVGLAAVGLPLLAPRVAVLDAATFIAAVATFAALTHPRPTRRTRRCAVLGLVASAACTPALSVILLPIAAWLGLRDRGDAFRGRSPETLAVGAAMLALLLGMWLVPARPGDGYVTALGCALPGGAPVDSWMGRPNLFGGVTPYMWGLAVLGAVLRRAELVAMPMRVGVAYGLAPVLVHVVGDTGQSHPEGPLVGLMLWLAAAGLTELVRASMARRGGAIAATFFVVLVPWSTLGSHGAPAATAVAAGHDAFTTRQMQAILRALPDGSTLVIDDAGADIAVRAVGDLWRRSGKSLEVVSGPALAVPPPRFAGRRVYAFPVAAGTLQASGFRPVDDPLVGSLPVRQLEAAGVCAQVPATWMATAAVAAEFAVMSQQPRDEGPAVFYLASDDRPEVATVDWPAPARRGFDAHVFDRRNADAALLAQMAEDEVPDALRPTAAPFVTRVEVWRTPGAPRILRVGLGLTPASAIVRLRVPAEAHRLFVCPAP